MFGLSEDQVSAFSDIKPHSWVTLKAHRWVTLKYCWKCQTEKMLRFIQVKNKTQDEAAKLRKNQLVDILSISTTQRENGQIEDGSATHTHTHTMVSQYV